MVGSYREKIELLFDFDEITKNKYLPWEKKWAEFLNLRQFHKKTLYLLIEFFDFVLEEEDKKEKIKFVKVYEQKILYNYLKQNVGCLCLDSNSFQKNCEIGCCQRIIKKYKENHISNFDYFFNKQLIEKMTERVRKKCKINLLEVLQ